MRTPAATAAPASTADEYTANTGWTAELDGPALWAHQGYKGSESERPNWSTNTLNDIAFTNRVFSFNGATIHQNLRAGAIATNELTVIMGINTTNEVMHGLSGYWGGLRLDNENGDAIIDYVPVQRNDGLVCFFDKAGQSVVRPTNWGSSDDSTHLKTTGCTWTGEIIMTGVVVEAEDIVPNSAIAHSQNEGTLTVTVPAGLKDVISFEEAKTSSSIA